jgi:3-isopropylmalate/(R)-2-methylmalate dehydratase small subunit
VKIWQYGDNINTDMLFPGKYTYTCSTAEEILPHLLEDLDPSFASSCKPGDIIMAGSNFGCGSSREQPALGLKAAGIQAVIAKSFARIFYRASINQGLLLIECSEAVTGYRPPMVVQIDATGGKITIGDSKYTFPGLPDEIMAIMEAGGLLNRTRALLKAQRG